MDEKGQASAEFILLFGGIIVVVLLAIYLHWLVHFMYVHFWNRKSLADTL